MKMNKGWQKAHDEAPAGAAAGIEHMHDAIAKAEQTEAGRTDAALKAFSDNTLALVGTGASPDAVKGLLAYTLKHFDEVIAPSVKHGHSKD